MFYIRAGVYTTKPAQQCALTAIKSALKKIDHGTTAVVDFVVLPHNNHKTNSNEIQGDFLIFSS